MSRKKNMRLWPNSITLLGTKAEMSVRIYFFNPPYCSHMNQQHLHWRADMPHGLFYGAGWGMETVHVCFTKFWYFLFWHMKHFQLVLFFSFVWLIIKDYRLLDIYVSWPVERNYSMIYWKYIYLWWRPLVTLKHLSPLNTFLAWFVTVIVFLFVNIGWICGYVSCMIIRIKRCLWWRWWGWWGWWW